jgi:hypothetical protein
MIEIYQKRGTWYLKEEGKDIKTFSSEQDAKESLGYKEPIEEECCECEDCDCDPCECEEDE